MTLSIATPIGRSPFRPSPVVLLCSRDVPHADRLLATGDIVRVRRGVFASGTAWRALPPWDRYLARVHAALLVHPGAITCLESAAALHSLPLFGDPGVVHLLDDRRGTSRDVQGIRTHTSAGDREILEVDGIRAVGAVDTAVDIARARHRAIGLAVADAVLRAEPAIGAAAVVVANENRLSSRGRRQARWVTHRASALAESPLESVSRAALEWLGFDQPELQRSFDTDGRIDRSDMWWARERVIGEADGDVKYDGSLQTGVDAIRAEKARDRRLVRHASGVAHWGWRDVLEVTPLRAELRRAGLRIRHAEDSRELAGLAGLARHPRP